MNSDEIASLVATHRALRNDISNTHLVIEADVVEAVVFHQTYDGVDTNSCEDAVPMITTVTATALGIDEQYVWVLPSGACNTIVTFLLFFFPQGK